MSDDLRARIAQQEIIAAIAFYDERGWDWLSAVAFLACCELGCLPMDVLARYHQRKKA